MELQEINKLGIGYLEHGPRDEKDAFWPHNCGECEYFQNDDCILDADRFAGLSLPDYLALRLQEAA